MTIHTDVAALLIDLEAELRRFDHWQAQPLPEAALASAEPFCIDTMTLAQWLQFVFIPRMHALAAAELPLPARCDIAPVAEEYFGSGAGAQRVIALIRELDTLISAA
jgi:uncharacterized protein YqcC (DUF446 family)